jgi:predicted nucleotidyltransferase
MNNFTDPRIKTIIQKVLQAANETLGEKLDKVILFGSYARGDFDNESDIDFFVLADVPNEETNVWRKNIDGRLPDLGLEYDLLVCIHVTSKSIFDRYFHVTPYFQNVVNEGVELYA